MSIIRGQDWTNKDQRPQLPRYMGAANGRRFFVGYVWSVKDRRWMFVVRDRSTGKTVPSNPMKLWADPENALKESMVHNRRASGPQHTGPSPFTVTEGP